jgi:hypothetical protein
MTILPLSRRRVAIAALAVVVVAGLGTFGAIRVDASSPRADHRAGSRCGHVVQKTITDWQSYSGRLEAVEKVDVVRRCRARSCPSTSRTARS